MILYSFSRHFYPGQRTVFVPTAKTSEFHNRSERFNTTLRTFVSVCVCVCVSVCVSLHVLMVVCFVTEGWCKQSSQTNPPNFSLTQNPKGLRGDKREIWQPWDSRTPEDVKPKVKRADLATHILEKPEKRWGQATTTHCVIGLFRLQNIHRHEENIIESQHRTTQSNI